MFDIGHSFSRCFSAKAVLFYMDRFVCPKQSCFSRNAAYLITIIVMTELSQEFPNTTTRLHIFCFRPQLDHRAGLSGSSADSGHVTADRSTCGSPDPVCVCEPLGCVRISILASVVIGTVGFRWRLLLVRSLLVGGFSKPVMWYES